MEICKLYQTLCRAVYCLTPCPCSQIQTKWMPMESVNYLYVVFWLWCFCGYFHYTIIIWPTLSWNIHDIASLYGCGGLRMNLLQNLFKTTVFVFSATPEPQHHRLPGPGITISGILILYPPPRGPRSASLRARSHTALWTTGGSRWVIIWPGYWYLMSHEWLSRDLDPGYWPLIG